MKLIHSHHLQCQSTPYPTLYPTPTLPPHLLTISTLSFTLLTETYPNVTYTHPNIYLIPISTSSHPATPQIYSTTSILHLTPSYISLYPLPYPLPSKPISPHTTILLHTHPPKYHSTLPHFLILAPNTPSPYIQIPLHPTLKPHSYH